MTTPSTDVDIRNPIALIRHSVADFAQVLPSHVTPETFVRLAVGALQRNPYLLRVASQNPASLLYALLEAARLGLEPGTEQFHLVPYGGRSPKVEGIVGYQGEIELIYRAGASRSVKAELVCGNDTFTFKPTMDRPEHDIDWFGDRGPVLGAYAYAEMVGGGTSRVVVVGPREIERAQQASASWNSKDKRDQSPWVTDYPAMVLKTAIHQLEKWVPTSAEYRREQLRASAAAAAEAANVTGPSTVAQVLADADPPPDDVQDAEIVDDPQETP